MPLTNGTRLGHYVIESPIGAGGMGEVYRAFDTRLDRPVALKVISDRLAATPEFRERLKREARVVAALDHPHICALFDVGEHEGKSFLVMQYLDGETLQRAMARGRLPLDRALDYAAQLASAVASAHRAGVVHRDIKPGNVIVTATGLRLLDFGLARQAPSVETPVDGAATITNVTEPGTVRGTPQYMAPEQLMGTAADARADLFALGVVIYELVAGSHPFAASTPAAVAQRILTSDPEPLSRIRSEVPPPLLQHIVEKCLERDPDSRWQSAADLFAALEWLRAKPSKSANLPAHGPRVRLRWLAATAALMAATAVITWRLLPSPRKDAEPIEFAVNLPAGMETSRIDGAVALSPDGRLLAFTALDNGNSHLFVRDLNSVEIRQLNGTDGAIWPFFSADGEWIGFSAPRGLRVVPLRSETMFARYQVRACRSLPSHPPARWPTYPAVSSLARRRGSTGRVTWNR